MSDHLAASRSNTHLKKHDVAAQPSLKQCDLQFFFCHERSPETDISMSRGGRNFKEDWRADVDEPLGLVIDKHVRVHINNIPLDAIEADGEDAMRSDFEAFGTIDRYTLFFDKSGRFNGSAMCTFVSAADAKRAIRALNRKVFDDGTLLTVTQAKEHGAVLASQLQHDQRDRTADNAPWEHDLFGRGGKPRFGGRGTERYGRGRGTEGRGEGRGGGRGRGREPRPEDPTAEALDNMLERYAAGDAGPVAPKPTAEAPAPAEKPASAQDPMFWE